MLKRRSILGLVLLNIILIFPLLLNSIAYASEDVTVEWDYWQTVSNPNSYWRLKVTYSDGTVEYYDGWCGDQNNYLPASGKTFVTLYSSTEGGLPTSISDDEEWDKVNYIFNKWPTSDTGSIYYGATWKDIQQVVWNVTDSPYVPSSSSHTPPAADDWGKVSNIITDVKNNGDGFVPSDSQLHVMILDLNNIEGGPKQLVFFLIPEIPLGTLGAAVTIFGAYFTKTRRNRHKK